MDSLEQKADLKLYQTGPKPNVYRFLMGITILAFLISLGLILMVFLEKPAITFTNIPFPLTENKVYRPGDTIAFVIKRCAEYPTKYTLTQTFVSETGTVERYHIESHELVVDKATCEIVSPIPRIIPAVLPSGKYHMEFGISIQGRFRDFIFTADSTSFKVESEVETPPEVETHIEYVATPQIITLPPQIIYEPIREVIRETNTTNTTKETKTETRSEDNTSSGSTPKEEKPVINRILDSII